VCVLNYSFETILNNFEFFFKTPINSTNYSVRKYTLYFMAKLQKHNHIII